MSFYTNTIMTDQRATATKVINDLSLLEPITRQLVQSIIKDAKAHGVDLMVFETYRSKERQLALLIKV